MFFFVDGWRNFKGLNMKFTVFFFKGEKVFSFLRLFSPGSGGRSALHAACERGDEYLIQLLVRSRADPSVVDSQGSTALDLLRRRGLPDGKILSMFNVTTPNASDGGTGSATDGL